MKCIRLLFFMGKCYSLSQGRLEVYSLIFTLGASHTAAKRETPEPAFGLFTDVLTVFALNRKYLERHNLHTLSFSSSSRIKSHLLFQLYSSEATGRIFTLQFRQVRQVKSLQSNCAFLAVFAGGCLTAGLTEKTKNIRHTNTS